MSDCFFFNSCILLSASKIQYQTLKKKQLLHRYQNSHSGGWDGTREAEEDAKAQARDHHCHSRTSVGPDQGETSASDQPQATQVSHNSRLLFTPYVLIESITGFGPVVLILMFF